MTRLRIAIDGPASSGKGTVARGVAKALDYAYIDTGAMYRVVGLLALEAGIDVKDEEPVAKLAQGLDFRFSWNGSTLQIEANGRDFTEAIRAEEVGRAASDVATLQAVRAALLHRQQALGEAGGVVMDGRDIGTVVLPDAELKIFLDASLEERARRRTVEMRLRGQRRKEEDMLKELRARDAQDSGRDVAPLRQAEGAVYLDTTQMKPAAVVERVVALAQEHGAGVAERPISQP